MASDPAALAELRDLHIPVPDAWGAAAESLAALSAGLFLAFLIAQVIRLVTIHRPRPGRKALKAIEQSRNLPRPDRIAAQAAALRDLEGSLEVSGNGATWRERLEPRLGDGFFADGPGAGLDAALYRGDPDFDPDRFEAAVTRSVRRMGA